MTTWFGGNTGATAGTIGTNTPIGQSFAAPVSGNITQARAQVGQDTASVTVKVLVYAVAAGVPGALLGQSDQLTVSGAISLNSFTFTTPVAVVSGTSYFLMLFCGPTLNVKANRATGVGTTYYMNPVGYPTPNDPFGTATTLGGFQNYLEAGIDPSSTSSARNQYSNQLANGIDMRTLKYASHPSLANGIAVGGAAEGTLTTTGFPSGVLGTGANPDLYTPPSEAV